MYTCTLYGGLEVHSRFPFLVSTFALICASRFPFVLICASRFPFLIPPSFVPRVSRSSSFVLRVSHFSFRPHRASHFPFVLICASRFPFLIPPSFVPRVSRSSSFVLRVSHFSFRPHLCLAFPVRPHLCFAFPISQSALIRAPNFSPPGGATLNL